MTEFPRFGIGGAIPCSGKRADGEHSADFPPCRSAKRAERCYAAALGRMFKSGLKLYVYPYVDESTGQLITAHNMEVAPNLRSLFRYLIDNEFIQEITHYNPEYLRIHPPEALVKIQSGDPSWETMVPPEVAQMIKSRGFFGYRASAAA